jgi:hypothetical protein
LCNRGWLQSGAAAQQRLAPDCLPLRFLKVVLPAKLVYNVSWFVGPAAGEAAALGTFLLYVRALFEIADFELKYTHYVIQFNNFSLHNGHNFVV